MAGLKAEVDLLYNAILNGPAVRITRYPTQAAAVGLTASGMTTGVYQYRAAGANQVQVIAAVTNATGMWIAGGSLRNPSAPSIFVLWIGRGTAATAVLAAELNFEDTQFVLAGAAAGAVTVDLLLPRDRFFPLPLFVRAGVGICADLASSNAAADDTANGTVSVYTGLGN